MENHTQNSSPFSIRWILIGLLVVAGVWLVADHGQHLVPFLPFAFLLGCLVMHLFMHGSHGGHNQKDNTDKHNHH
ncbi:MAG: hypothetical protein A2980_01600 [Candidatus Staskawiczbacteria bacterium RIFCSPLOWO2_01_FULL_33_13]|nr:MAG: hypothetical protein A2980_01600 [Candidatus Staskawiczbacteria bacterium RIFCSPLOWO2_01_FULL_33_13]